VSFQTDGLHRRAGAAATPDVPRSDDLVARDRGPHERHPLRIGLSAADGGGPIDPEEWAGRLPQTNGIAPRFRIGSRWINLLWLIPLSVALLIVLIAVAKGLRGMPGVEAFVRRHPGTLAPAQPDAVGIPWWARWQHFFNLFFLMFIVRSGLQILADHPRLYFDRNCTPGRDWFRFQKPVPLDRVWTAKEDSVRLPGWLGIPGLRHSIGLARWWHFGFDLLWLLNGALFYALIFASGHWQRLVPMSWQVFPNAGSVLLQYLSLQWPRDNGWIAYNGLQLLAYFVTVFVAAPLALLTGLLQSPAISNRVRLAGRRFNHQLARTVHFWVLCWFVVFTFLHGDGVHDRAPAEPQPHRPRQQLARLGRLRRLRRLDGGRRRRLVGCNPVDAPPPSGRAARRPRADRPGPGTVRAPRPATRRVRRARHRAPPVAERPDAGDGAVRADVGERLRRLPALGVR
jgi:thiosulfate reductase cytochrome b subunit